MNDQKKKLQQEARQSPPVPGVFQIRNLVSEKILVGSALNLTGVLNRHRFELQAGSHRNRALQQDWNELGADKFAFEILDEISLRDDPNDDCRADLTFLESLWLERLQPWDERGYNERKLSREEQLRRIARHRLEKQRLADKE